MTAHKRRHTTQPFALCKLSYFLYNRILKELITELSKYFSQRNIIKCMYIQKKWMFLVF